MGIVQHFRIPIQRVADLLDINRHCYTWKQNQLQIFIYRPNRPYYGTLFPMQAKPEIRLLRVRFSIETEEAILNVEFFAINSKCLSKYATLDSHQTKTEAGNSSQNSIKVTVVSFNQLTEHNLPNKYRTATKQTFVEQTSNDQFLNIALYVLYRIYIWKSANMLQYKEVHTRISHSEGNRS